VECRATAQTAPGAALLYRTTGELLQVQILNTTGADVERVASLLATPRLQQKPESSRFEAVLKPADMPDGSQMVAEADWLRTAPASAEAARAASLFLGGMDLSAIVWELRGVRSSQGGKYQVALAEVQALLRAALAGQDRR
jgi:hypothetical protein